MTIWSVNSEWETKLFREYARSHQHTRINNICGAEASARSPAAQSVISFAVVKMSQSWRLCRICEFPAAESGVRLDALDAEKLAEWWKQKLGAELEITTYTEEANTVIICQFCIWEAR
jgi:hypothetical protein